MSAGSVCLVATERWERAVVVDAGWCSTAAAATTATEATIATGTVGATIAAEATTATTTFAAVAAVTTIATSTATAATGGLLAILGEVTAWVDVSHVDSDLLLLLSEASGLATAASHVVLLILLAGEGFALWELLGCALVGLADGEITTELELLLSLLGEVLLIALALDFWLSWLGALVVDWWWDAGVEALGLLGLSNGLASLLIGKLSIARFTSPTMSCLLRVLAVALC